MGTGASVSQEPANANAARNAFFSYFNGSADRYFDINSTQSDEIEQLYKDKLAFRLLLDEPNAVTCFMEFGETAQLTCWNALNAADLIEDIDYDCRLRLLYDTCTELTIYGQLRSELDILRHSPDKYNYGNTLSALSSTLTNEVSTDRSREVEPKKDAKKSYIGTTLRNFLCTFKKVSPNGTEPSGCNQFLRRLHKDAIMICFDHLYEHLFLPFRETPRFTELVQSLNCPGSVCDQDFDFFHRLGSGGFGSIFTCRKRTTGVMYAMKIQPKAQLLRIQKPRNKFNVMIEELACTNCRHPYICEAEYAFQSTKLVFLALPIYACGDLRRALLGEPTGYFSRERAKFYIAVVASVLMYLHSHGLIYRDLKPENLLLHSDGHIALCDLGSIADEIGFLSGPLDPIKGHSPSISRLPSQLSRQHSRDSNDPLSPSSFQNAYSFSRDPSVSQATPYGRDSSHVNNTTRMHLARGKGVFGTMAYMAPEVISQFADKAFLAMQQPYTTAVDWFSLGVLAHEFLLGKKPFIIPVDLNGAPISYHRLSKGYPDVLRGCNYDIAAAFTSIFGARMEMESREMTAVGSDGLQLLDGLLTLSPTARLGGREDNEDAMFPLNEYAQLRSQPFFRGIDWEMLEAKQVTPPFIPGNTMQCKTNKPLTCEAILTQNKLASWCDEFCEKPTSPTTVPTSAVTAAINTPRSLSVSIADQDHFRSWEYVHPKAIILELIAKRSA